MLDAYIKKKTTSMFVIEVNINSKSYSSMRDESLVYTVNKID